MKPDTYIGSDEAVEREEWLYDSENQKMINSVISFPPGCERLYLEVLTNASDNVGRSRRAGVDPGTIEVMMDETTISVKNYGLGIPVEMHPEKKVYVPQMIFGSLLTSSNYNGDRHEAGTNGIGAKAANIFSKEFMVVVHDHLRHLKYTQVWNNNMTTVSQPLIEKYTGKSSSTQIVYKMDFERFKLPGAYPPEAFALFARHAIDISFTAKTIVTFNEVEFNFTDIREYARLYFGDAVDSAVVHYQWPAGTEVVTKKKGHQVAKDPSVTPEVEMIVADTPDSGYHVSFVNCMMTKDGGVHVNAALKAVGDGVVQKINEDILKKLTKQNGGKELDAKQKKAHTINISDVRPHLSLLLSVRVVNPKFTSQTKTVLASPTPKITIEEQELRPIQNWKLVDRLYAALEAKQFASIAKTDGKLRRNVTLRSGTDANNAGKANRQDCVLYITEGRSGSGYANKLVSYIPNGRDNIGVLPMRGKLFNVMGKDIFQIEKNAEINELKKMLGLREGMDYLDPNNFNTLRYGAVMIMSDSDVDGKHITGLILNFFHCRFPSLLARGFVMYYRTPTIRVFKGKTVLKFYTQSEYDQWKTNTSDFKSWKHKYYKGLGGSKDSEVKDDLNAPRIVNCVYDDQAPAAIELAFNKKFADKRKEWIGSWQPVLGVEDIQMQPISWFINYEMILFSIADNDRSLPKLTDGLKESHRKILHGAHKRWKISTKKNDYPEFKVAQFSAFVANVSNYHHGEMILDDVVVGMAQDFTGANNIPWFTREGQFGSRFAGGKDASETRYSHTKPENIVAYILREEDVPILKYVVDDGEDVEPETYWPVIPMSLVNGCQGIGTGYSTFIPNHNPLDLIEWLKQKLRGVSDEDLPVILPWYRGFEGITKVIDRSKKKKRGGKVRVLVMDCAKDSAPKVVEEEDEEGNSPEKLRAGNCVFNEEGEQVLSEDEEEVDQRPLLSFVTQGKFHQLLDGTIVITELPVGRCAFAYNKWLEMLREKGELRDIRNLSGDNRVYFEITGFKGEVSIKSLKLQRTMGMSNMVLLDENRRPVRYDTTFDILEAFFARRLPVYGERRQYILDTLRSEITDLGHKVKFVTAVVNGELVIIKTKLEVIKSKLQELEIPFEIYNSSKTSNFNEEEIELLKEKIRKKEEELVTAENTTPEQMWYKELTELEEQLKK